MIVTTDRLVIRPPMMPARSETRNQWCFSIDARPSERPGTVTSGSVSAGGDCLGLPPASAALPSAKNSLARYWVAPSASRLTATPETMWSTPKVMVATACTRPPRTPKAMPQSRPSQGLDCQPIQPAPKVPRIIMPSRPMLTTPARSDHRPASPARPMGTARPRAAATCPAESSWLAPVITRTAARSSSAPATIMRVRPRERPERWGAPAALGAAGGGASVIVAVITPPPASSSGRRPGRRVRRRRAAAGASARSGVRPRRR